MEEDESSYFDQDTCVWTICSAKSLLILYRSYQEMTKVLLERPFLLKLCFHFDNNMKQMALTFDGKSREYIETKKLSYTVMKYKDDSDPIPCHYDLK